MPKLKALYEVGKIISRDIIKWNCMSHNLVVLWTSFDCVRDETSTFVWFWEWILGLFAIFMSFVAIYKIYYMEIMMKISNIGSLWVMCMCVSYDLIHAPIWFQFTLITFFLSSCKLISIWIHEIIGVMYWSTSLERTNLNIH